MPAALLYSFIHSNQSKMKLAIVTYKNGAIIRTSINGTDEEIKNYFKIGRYFNIGTGINGDEDNLQPVISCQVYESEINYSTSLN